MGVHSRRGPSQTKRARACPGTFAMAESIPKELRHGHGDAARLGTATHAVIEHCLKHDKNPDDLRDRLVLIIENEDGEGCSILKPGAKMPARKADQFVFIVDDSMVDDADVAVEYVRNRCQELGVATSKLQLETRTNPLPRRDDTSGTADIAIPAWPELLEVDDYKNGGLLVEATDNDQAMSYLLGKAIESDWSFERYAAGIIQPNSPHADGPIRIVEYTEAELKAFQKALDADFKKCEQAEAEFTSADDQTWVDDWLKAGDHCVFCPAGAACPKRRQYAEEQARIEFDAEPRELQLPAVVKPGEVAGTTEEQAARILDWAPYLMSLIKSAQMYAHRALEAGYDVPGYKLVARRSVRKLKDGITPEEIIEATGLTKAQLFTTPKLKSGPQLEKLVPRKLRKKFSDDFLWKPDNGTAIARIDDTRSSVQSNILEEFGEDE